MKPDTSITTLLGDSLIQGFILQFLCRKKLHYDEQDCRSGTHIRSARIRWRWKKPASSGFLSVVPRKQRPGISGIHRDAVGMYPSCRKLPLFCFSSTGYICASCAQTFTYCAVVRLSLILCCHWTKPRLVNWFECSVHSYHQIVDIDSLPLVSGYLLLDKDMQFMLESELRCSAEPFHCL
jgi:hypothetical protein